MTEPSTIRPDRFEVEKKMLDILKDGDVLYRGSDARGAFGFPFMRYVSKLTESPYTHAAIVRIKNREIFVAEATDTGTMFFRFIDWYPFCIDGKFRVYELDTDHEATDQQKNDIRRSIAERTDDYLRRDLNYAYNFDDNGIYCTQLVSWIYKDCGFTICEPQVIKEIVGWHKYVMIEIGNKLFTTATHGAQSLPMKTPLYYVGNETNGGMMASPIMKLKYDHLGD